MPMSLQELADFVAAEPLGVVATNNPRSGPEAALVSFAVSADGAIIFDTLDDSRKVANLRADARVALVLGCGGEVSVQVEGVALFPSSTDRQQWVTEYETHFPGSRAGEPKWIVVRVEPRWLRVYDASGSTAVVREGTPDWVAALPDRGAVQ